MTTQQKAGLHVDAGGLATGLLLVFVLVAGLDPPPGTAAEVATQAIPSFEFITFTGEVFSDKSLQGRPALLVFWAPWCTVCRKELPLLEQFYRQTKPAQLLVLSIGFADTRTNVEAFVKARPGVFVFPTGYDDDRWVANAFRVNATPTYVLVDAKGNVVLVHRGAGLLQNARFHAFLATLNG